MTTTANNDNAALSTTNTTKTVAAKEIDSIKKNFQQIQIESATNHFITFSYKRTEYAKVKATLTFPEAYYPEKQPLIVHDIRWVPPGLQKKLERELSKVAQELVPLAQAEAVVQRLITFIDTNLFVPCWNELRKAVDLVLQQQPQATISTIALNDKKGLIHLRLTSGKYYYACSIGINPNYPSTTTHAEWGNACKLTVKSTNLPYEIEQEVLTAQAKALVRRLQDGMNAADAQRMSNPIMAPHDNDNDDDDDGPHQTSNNRLSKDAIKGLHQDVETMARVRDLRNVNATTKTHGNAKVHAPGARERKDTRRTITKNTKQQEQTKDLQQQQQQEEEWKQHEQSRLESYNIPDYAGSDPQPSLLSLVTFLRDKIQRLPEEHCPVCKLLTLPSNPNELQALYAKQDNLTDKERQARKKARRNRPIRTYCGCWFHYSCLDTFMTEPPFGAACPTVDCGRRVYHPDWPADIKKLERNWATKQARQRDIEDAAMFL